MSNSREQLGAVKKIARRRWPILLAAFAVVLAPIQTAITVLPDIYQSTARVLIEDQQIPRELVRPTVTTGLETRLQAISQEILSRSQLAALIERFQLYQEPSTGNAPVEKLAAIMRHDIIIDMQASGRASTVAFTISYRGRDPQKVAEVTNTLASMYAEHNLEIRSQQASSTSDFFKGQLDEMKARLVEIESQVGAFKSAHVGELPHQQDANVATLGQLNTRLGINNDHQIRVSERIRQLEGELRRETKASDTMSPDASALKLSQLKQELRELRLKFNEKYPDVIRLKAQIEALEARQGETGEASAPAATATVALDDRTGSVRKALDEARVELRALEAEAATLNESISTYEQRVKAAPLREQQYQVLMRDYETTSEMYRSLLLRQKEAEIAETMERREKGERFEILDNALAADAPAAPDRPRLRVAGFVLAAVLAIGLGFLLETLDGSYHSLVELQRESKIPVLASIPVLHTSQDRRRRRQRFLVGFAATTLLIVAVSGASYKICAGNETIVGMLIH